ncbi:unnamed protein product [Scytosiphon promiscuus]
MEFARQRRRAMKVPALMAVCLCCLPPSCLTFRTDAGRPMVSCGRSFKRARPRTHETIMSHGDPRQPAAGQAAEQSVWTDHVELDSQGKVMLKGLLFSETERLMERLGEKPGRAGALAGWLYHDRCLGFGPVDFRTRLTALQKVVGRPRGSRASCHSSRKTNAVSPKSRIGRKTREAIGAVATADGGLALEDVQLAVDGTRKLVSVLTAGEGVGKKVETVIIPMLRGPQKEPRYTICVSSQVGCAMNCQFCFTGRLGLMANLQAAQIVEQVVVAKRFLESVGDPHPVTGVVFMGMGEPFDNYARVMRAVKILTDPRAGMRLKASSVTVSTVGLVPQIEQFCTDADNGASLAISLHAVTDGVRDKLIPVNRRYPLERLSEALRTHFPRSVRPSTDEPTAAPRDRREDHVADQVADGRAVSLPTTSGDNVLEVVSIDVDGAEDARSLAATPTTPVEAVAKSGVEKDTSVAEMPTPRESGVSSPSAGGGSERRVRGPTEESDGGGGGGDDGEEDRPRRRKARRKSRILAVEYTLLRGVNDSLEDAGRLADWLEGVACVVNLITFNAHEGTPFASSSVETSEAFRQALAARGQLCTFRDSRGDDGMAACGQLGGESMARGGDQERRRVPVAWKPSSTSSSARSTTA